MAIPARFFAILTAAGAAAAQTPPTCPAHVHFNSAFGKVGDLPHDGTFAYSGADGYLYFSRIKTPNPVKVAAVKGMVRPGFSPDGKWLICVVSNSVWIAKADGSMAKDLAIPCKNEVSWYYSSPKENPAAHSFEFAWIDPNAADAWAQLIDLSGAQPVLGAKRKLASGVTKLADGEEFSVAGNRMLWDSRNIQSGATVVFTLPDGGSGVAGPGDFYNVSAKYHCAVALNATGTLWITNVSWYRGGYDAASMQCIPCASTAFHTGFVILKPRDPGDSLVRMQDWCMQPGLGAVSLNWSPEQTNGVKTRVLNEESGTGVTTFNWYGGPWTNDDDYVCANEADHPSVKTIFLLNWKTNTWTPLLPYGAGAGWPAAWFDGVEIQKPTTALRGAGEEARRTRRSDLDMARILYLQGSRDALGRRPAAPAGR